MSRRKGKHAARRKPATGRLSAEEALKTQDGTPREVAGVCIALAVAVWLVFGRSVGFDFVDFDDPGIITENPLVRSGLTMAGIGGAFTQSLVSSWVPLTAMSHMLDCQVFGLWAGGHHLTSVLLHAATSVLLFLVLREMTGSLWRCAFVAALFALHPLRAESVVWISERKDVLSGLFFMLTLGAYVRWTRQPAVGRWWTFLFLALGLLSKAMLITTPLVLLLLDHWPLRRTAQTSFKRLVIEKAPLFLLSLAAAAAQLLVAGQAIASSDERPLTLRVANAVVSCATYVVQMAWPANLAAVYPYPRHGVGTVTLLAASVLLIAISVAACRWRRRFPWFAVGWLWHLVMLLPVLGLIQAGDAARADRYTYLPQIGLYLILAWSAGTWCAGQQNRRVLCGALAVVVLVAMSVATFRQTGFWKDTKTLWNRALACTPDNDTAHYNLGTTLLREGRLDEAIAHFEKTLEANPAYVKAHINLGQAFLQKGMPDRASAHYHSALEARPRLPQAQYNLAVALEQLGRMDEAIAHYELALEADPALFDARNNLGSALLKAGRVEEAIRHYEEALRTSPGSARAHHNLATALMEKGRIAEAVAHYSKVVEIDPKHVNAHVLLAWLLATSANAAIRDGTRAVELARRANHLTGESQPVMLRTLAAAFAEAGRFEDALQSAQRALDIVVAQGNERLAGSLRREIGLYKTGRPMREGVQAPGAP